jgi:formate hydrogenlyase subunit 3/multisubunit Na+/H+ antiporter MnhD subunit
LVLFFKKEPLPSFFLACVDALKPTLQGGDFCYRTQVIDSVTPSFGLPLLGLAFLGLLVMAIVAAAPVWRGAAAGGMAGLGGLILIVGVAVLIAGPTQGAVIQLPLGLPGAGMVVALDPLSALFCLPVGLSMLGSGAWSMAGKRPISPLLPVFAAGMLLTLLAGDGWTMMFGFELMSVSSWVVLLGYTADAEGRAAAQFYLGMAVFSGVCLVPALALLAPDAGLDFGVVRRLPPEGWRAAAVMVLVVLGAGSKAGLAPLHPWLPPAHAAAPPEASAMMSGAMTKVALYVLIRVLFDLCGPVAPLWWCVPLLVMGAAGALIGALRATQEGDLKTVLACSTIEHIGLIAIGLALALAARASDLGWLARLALSGALLHVLVHAAFKTLLFLAAGSAQAAAGTRRLDRLGGLILRMPVVTCCVLVAACSLAGLPPSAGFASEWVLLQAVIAAPRIGGFGMQTLFTVVAAVMALAVALSAVAAVRLVGVGFLGRPRVPRTAGADEAPVAARAALVGLAAVLAMIGVVPGLVMALFAPVVRQLLAAPVTGQTALLGITPQADAPGYSAVAVTALLVVALAGVLLAVRRWMGGEQRRAAAWDGGFAPPPPWLPFGEPAAQYGGVAFAEPVARTLGSAVLAARETVGFAGVGDPSPARFSAGSDEPALRFLFTPLLWVRHVVSARLDPVHRLTIRQWLTVMVLALVFMLVLIAAQASR